MDALIRYLGTLRLYGADVLILASGVSLLTSLLKKTVFKKASKKIFVFLPYVFGLIFYGVYRAVVTRSAAPFTHEFFATTEGGFAVGCVATLYYVIYEQFFRGKKNGAGNALTPLLEGVVPAENVAEISEILLAQSAGKSREEIAALVKETLSATDCALTDAETELYCNLVTAYLTELQKK